MYKVFIGVLSIFLIASVSINVFQYTQEETDVATIVVEESVSVVEETNREAVVIEGVEEDAPHISTQKVALWAHNDDLPRYIQTYGNYVVCVSDGYEDHADKQIWRENNDITTSTVVDGVAYEIRTGCRVESGEFVGFGVIAPTSTDRVYYSTDHLFVQKSTDDAMEVYKVKEQSIEGCRPRNFKVTTEDNYENPPPNKAFVRYPTGLDTLIITCGYGDAGYTSETIYRFDTEVNIPEKMYSCNSKYANILDDDGNFVTDEYIRNCDDTDNILAV